jgi:hypothetical protein
MNRECNFVTACSCAARYVTQIKITQSRLSFFLNLHICEFYLDRTLRACACRGRHDNWTTHGLMHVILCVCVCVCISGGL